MKQSDWTPVSVGIQKMQNELQSLQTYNDNGNLLDGKEWSEMEKMLLKSRQNLATVAEKLIEYTKQTSSSVYGSQKKKKRKSKNPKKSKKKSNKKK